MRRTWAEGLGSAAAGFSLRFVCQCRLMQLWGSSSAESEARDLLLPFGGTLPAPATHLQEQALFPSPRGGVIEPGSAERPHTGHRTQDTGICAYHFGAKPASLPSATPHLSPAVRCGEVPEAPVALGYKLSLFADPFREPVGILCWHPEGFNFSAVLGAQQGLNKDGLCRPEPVACCLQRGWGAMQGSRRLWGGLEEQGRSRSEPQNLALISLQIAVAFLPPGSWGPGWTSSLPVDGDFCA